MNVRARCHHDLGALDQIASADSEGGEGKAVERTRGNDGQRVAGQLVAEWPEETSTEIRQQAIDRSALLVCPLTRLGVEARDPTDLEVERVQQTIDRRRVSGDATVGDVVAAHRAGPELVAQSMKREQGLVATQGVTVRVHLW